MTNAHEAEAFSSNHRIPYLAEPEDISIVMAVYNHEATVAEALESALMQEMPYRSVIYCLNDASTDKSAEILSEYEKKYPGRIKVFTSPVNQGLGKKSIYYHKPPVRGRYWCLLAGDDFWTSRDKLAKQITFLDSHPDYTGCSCNTVMKNEVTGEESILKPEKNTWNLLDLLLHTGQLYVHASSIVWRNIYLEQGFFLPPAFSKEFVYGDVLLTRLMLCKGGKIQNIPDVMSCYRYTGRGIWSSKSVEEQAHLNKIVAPKMISQCIPFRYRIYVFFRKLVSKIIRNLIPKIIRNLIPKPAKIIIKKLIPGPINE